MHSIRLASWLLIGGVAAAACGGKDFNSAGSGAGGEGGLASEDGQSIALEDLPEQYAQAFCEVFTRCAGDLYGIFRPGEACLRTYAPAAAEALASLPHAIDTGRVKYHPTKVKQCLDEVAGGDCSTLAARESATCQAAIEGTIAEGGECELDVECAGDQYCKVDGACPGTCEPYEQAGGSCLEDGNCASGLICGDNARCVAPAEQGEPCQQGEPKCADGLLCLGEDSTAKTPGSCYLMAEALSGKAGDACSLDGRLCAAGYACEITSLNPVAGRCVPKGAENADCKAALPDVCPDHQFCAWGQTPLLGGKCTDKPRAGEACAMGLGAATICAPYTRCDDGACRELATAGETCNSNDTCYSGHCVENTCVTGNSCN